MALGHLLLKRNQANLTPFFVTAVRMLVGLLENCFAFEFHTQLFWRTLKVLGVRNARVQRACAKVAQPQACRYHTIECLPPSISVKRIANTIWVRNCVWIVR